MTEPKQWILVRKDLKMPKGKLAAQVAHASMGAVLELFKAVHDVGHGLNSNITQIRKASLINYEKAMACWLEGSFVKVVVGVENEAHLQNMYDMAYLRHLPCCLIRDQGRTVFKEPTITCAAIGPCEPEAVSDWLGDLKLL